MASFLENLGRGLEASEDLRNETIRKAGSKVVGAVSNVAGKARDSLVTGLSETPQMRMAVDAVDAVSSGMQAFADTVDGQDSDLSFTPPDKEPTSLTVDTVDYGVARGYDRSGKGYGVGANGTVLFVDEEGIQEPSSPEQFQKMLSIVAHSGSSDPRQSLEALDDSPMFENVSKALKDRYGQMQASGLWNEQALNDFNKEVYGTMAGSVARKLGFGDEFKAGVNPAKAILDSYPDLIKDLPEKSGDKLTRSETGSGEDLARLGDQFPSIAKENGGNIVEIGVEMVERGLLNGIGSYEEGLQRIQALVDINDATNKQEALKAQAQEMEMTTSNEATVRQQVMDTFIPIADGHNQRTRLGVKNPYEATVNQMMSGVFSGSKYTKSLMNKDELESLNARRLGLATQTSELAINRGMATFAQTGSFGTKGQHDAMVDGLARQVQAGNYKVVNQLKKQSQAESDAQLKRKLAKYDADQEFFTSSQMDAGTKAGRARRKAEKQKIIDEHTGGNTALDSIVDQALDTVSRGGVGTGENPFDSASEIADLMNFAISNDPKLKKRMEASYHNAIDMGQSPVHIENQMIMNQLRSMGGSIPAELRPAFDTTHYQINKAFSNGSLAQEFPEFAPVVESIRSSIREGMAIRRQEAQVANFKKQQAETFKTDEMVKANYETLMMGFNPQSGSVGLQQMQHKGGKLSAGAVPTMLPLSGAQIITITRNLIANNPNMSPELRRDLFQSSSELVKNSKEMEDIAMGWGEELTQDQVQFTAGLYQDISPKGVKALDRTGSLGIDDKEAKALSKALEVNDRPDKGDTVVTAN